MSRWYTVYRTIILVLLAVAILGGMVWANTYSARTRPVEKDFLVPWLAAQTFLQFGDPADPERITPYSDPATRRAQVVYYGRIASEEEHALELWLPFPAHLFYFPFALIPDYALACGLWMTLAEAALVGTVILAIRLTGGKKSRLILPLALLFPVLWIFGLMNILAASPVPFVLAACLGCLVALRAEQDEIAGALLALLFLKMGIFSGVGIFLLWWAVYHRRGRFLAGLGMTLGILLLLAFLFLPDWLFPFLHGLFQHVPYTPALSTQRSLAALWPVFGPRLGWVLTGCLSLLLLIEWSGVRRQDLRHILWTVCLTLVVTPLLGFPVSLQDLSALLLPIFLLFVSFGERWKGRKFGFISGLLLLITLVLPWGLAQIPGALLFLPVLLVIGLYWMKWWATRPPRTLLEMLP